jgi:hypothetical protein
MVPAPCAPQSIVVDQMLPAPPLFTKPQSEPDEGGSSSATPSLGYGSHGTKRWYGDLRSAIFW